ncbi:MAG: ABC transporter substrate-binding protein [Burkholderiales bacterium]
MNRLFTWTFALIAVVLAQVAVAQTKITLGYTGANAFVAAFVAKDQGFFAKRGLDVTMQLVPVGSTIAAAMAGGSLQVGTLTPPAFLLSVEGGIESQIVSAATFQSKANITTGVAAREGSNIKTPADFRGKRVGVPGLNGVNHVTFMKWLKDRGVDPKQVTYVEAFFPQMGDLLKGGQVDAVLPVEPFLGRIVQSKVGYVVAPYAAEVSENYLESFYIMTRDFMQKNPQAAGSFKEAIREAVEWIGKNEEAARKTQITYLKLPEAIAMSIRMPTLTVDVNPKDMQFWIDLCKDFGVTKGTATVQQVLR